MLDDDARVALADRLHEAGRTARPIPPLTAGGDAIDVADAYDIQTINIRRLLEAGDTIAGHKIGLTSPAMQEMMGVSTPDFGHVLGSMVLDADRPIDLSPYIQPRVEVEIAYVLGADLVGPGITRADVEAATEAVVPCLELIDSRIENWRIGLADTIADNASSAGLILGADRFPGSVLAERPVPARLVINDVEVARGSTADVLGHPAEAVAWLANALGEFGVALRRGHVVLSGSCTRAVDVAPGDLVRAAFEGLGELEVRFG